jgi:signal transduction histidine kinase
MTEEDLNMVFNEFMTLSARPTGKERSTGLGLAIVKMLVEGMDGTITAESEGKGKGTTFTVMLPHPQKS